MKANALQATSSRQKKIGLTSPHKTFAFLRDIYIGNVRDS